MRFHRCLIRTLVAAVALASSSVAVACFKQAEAEDYYQMARAAAKAGSHTQAQRFYVESMQLCPPSFNVLYRYGDSLYANGELDKARQQYQAAMQLKVPDKQYARALAKEARIDAAQDKWLLAARKLKDARKLYPAPWILKLSDRVNKARAGRSVDSDELLRSLSLSTRMVGEPASVDIYIHFDLNSHELSETGHFEVEQLALALSDDSLRDKRFRIVGHADARGSAEHNLALSEQRAERVRQTMLVLSGMDPDRVDVAGMGFNELLCEGNDEDAHSCNRRVELLVLE